MFFDNPMLFRPGSSGIAAPARAQDHHYAVRRASGNLSPRSVGFGMRRLVPCWQIPGGGCELLAWDYEGTSTAKALQDHGVAATSSSTVCQATRPWRTSPLRLWVGALEIPAIATTVRPSQKCCM